MVQSEKKRLRRCVLKKSLFSLFKNGEKRIWEDSLLGSNLLKTETARSGSKRRGKRRSEMAFRNEDEEVVVDNGGTRIFEKKKPFD